MSDKAKRTSWIIGLLTVIIAATGLIGKAAGHWSDLSSRVTANEVKIIQADARMTRSEEVTQKLLADTQEDINWIKRHLMERNQ